MGQQEIVQLKHGSGTLYFFITASEKERRVVALFIYDDLFFSRIISKNTEPRSMYSFPPRETLAYFGSSWYD